MTEPADQLGRDARAALRREFRTKCPNCGEGDVLQSYLKVKNTCEVRQLNLRYARADDGPAYLTIPLVGPREQDEDRLYLLLDTKTWRLFVRVERDRKKPACGSVVHESEDLEIGEILDVAGHLPFLTC